MLHRILWSACFAILTTGVAHASIISVSGPNSNLGTAPAIIAAPADVLDDAVTNTGMQGFDEGQGVLTSIAYAIDGGGSIAAGTLVDSHMIFLNSASNTELTHKLVEWTFDGNILGVMSDSAGNREAASTAELGAAATNYTITFAGSGSAAPFGNRGLESSDSYTVAGNVLTTSMRVTEPGDWIRVVTSGTDTTVIPLPASLPLALAGMLALGWTTRRRIHRTA